MARNAALAGFVSSHRKRASIRVAVFSPIAFGRPLCTMHNSRKAAVRPDTQPRVAARFMFESLLFYKKSQ
jgi:hypothetical protein